MKSSIHNAYRQIKEFPIVLVAIIIELFLMINGSYLFQVPSIYNTTQIEIFVLTIALFSLLAGYTIESGLNFKTFKTLKYFVPSLLIAFIVSIFLNSDVSVLELTGNTILGLLVYSIFIVAFSQEIAFRVIATELLRKSGFGKVSTVISQALIFGILYFSFYSNGITGTYQPDLDNVHKGKYLYYAFQYITWRKNMIAQFSDWSCSADGLSSLSMSR